MTIREILVQVIIEASDKPKEINCPAEELFSILNFKTNIDDSLSDDKAEALLATLWKNLPSVRKFSGERKIL